MMRGRQHSMMMDFLLYLLSLSQHFSLSFSPSLSPFFSFSPARVFLYLLISILCIAHSHSSTFVSFSLHTAWYKHDEMGLLGVLVSYFGFLGLSFGICFSLSLSLSLCVCLQRALFSIDLIIYTYTYCSFIAFALGNRLGKRLIDDGNNGSSGGRGGRGGSDDNGSSAAAVVGQRHHAVVGWVSGEMQKSF